MGDHVIKRCRCALYINTPIKTRLSKYSSPTISSCKVPAVGRKHTEQKKGCNKVSKKSQDQKGVLATRVQPECEKREVGRSGRNGLQEKGLLMQSTANVRHSTSKTNRSSVPKKGVVSKELKNECQKPGPASCKRKGPPAKGLLQLKLTRSCENDGDVEKSDDSADDSDIEPRTANMR